MRNLKCSLQAKSLGANLLQPRRTPRGEVGFAHWRFSDTIHTQSYNNLRFPQRGSHIQPLRLTRRGGLS